MKSLRLPFEAENPIKPMVLDVETQYLSNEVEGGWNSIEKFKVSVTVSWDEANGLRVWHEEDIARFLTEASTYNPIITFNGEGFDFRVLSAYGDVSNLFKYSKDLLKYLKSALGFRVHLDNVAHATLGTEKTATGLQAVEWWRSGDPKLQQMVIDYCKKDVEITRDIYVFAKTKGYLFYTDAGQKKQVNIGL